MRGVSGGAATATSRPFTRSAVLKTAFVIGSGSDRFRLRDRAPEHRWITRGELHAWCEALRDQQAVRFGKSVRGTRHEQVVLEVIVDEVWRDECALERIRERRTRVAQAVV